MKKSAEEPSVVYICDYICGPAPPVPICSPPPPPHRKQRRQNNCQAKTEQFINILQHWYKCIKYHLVALEGVYDEI
jgi:hypothetical protein